MGVLGGWGWGWGVSTNVEKKASAAFTCDVPQDVGDRKRGGSVVA